jgi:hypothetical protein
MSTESEFTFKQKEYKCEKCNKFYSSKSSLCNHNKRFHKPIASESPQFPQSLLNISSNSSNDNESNNSICIQNQCKYCNKILSRIDNLIRHEKICKSKPKIEETTELKQEIHELKNTMNEILKTIKIHPKTLEKINKQLNNCNNTTNNTINNTNSNNTTNNTINNTNSNNTINNIINNNITLVKFGEENLEKTLTKREKVKILENMYYSLEESIKLTHFNKKHPEMHNICITNLRDEIGYVYNGGNKFDAVPKKEIYNQLIHKHIEHIELSMNIYKEYLSDYKINKLKCFIEQIENKEKEYNREEKKYKTYEHYQREKIKLLLFNESNKNKKIFNKIYKELEELEKLQ